MLDAIHNSGIGILILGTIGSIIAILVLRFIGGRFYKVSPKYAHEVHIFRLLFAKTSLKRDNTDHLYLLVPSCAFTLGLLILTCTSAIVFQIVKLNDSSAYYSLILLFITTVLCLYGVIKGIDSVNRLLELHLNQKEIKVVDKADAVVDNLVKT